MDHDEDVKAWAARLGIYMLEAPLHWLTRNYLLMPDDYSLSGDDDQFHARYNVPTIKDVLRLVEHGIAHAAEKDS
jgi:hypothetical protein